MRNPSSFVRSFGYFIGLLVLGHLSVSPFEPINFPTFEAVTPRRVVAAAAGSGGRPVRGDL
jgi:hypothetical protein